MHTPFRSIWSRYDNKKTSFPEKRGCVRIDYNTCRLPLIFQNSSLLQELAPCTPLGHVGCWVSSGQSLHRLWIRNPLFLQLFFQNTIDNKCMASILHTLVKGVNWFDCFLFPPVSSALTRSAHLFLLLHDGPCTYPLGYIPCS